MTCAHCLVIVKLHRFHRLPMMFLVLIQHGVGLVTTKTTKMGVPDNMTKLSILMMLASSFGQRISLPSVRLTHKLVLTAVVCEAWMIGIGTLSTVKPSRHGLTKT